MAIIKENSEQSIFCLLPFAFYLKFFSEEKNLFFGNKILKLVSNGLVRRKSGRAI